MLQDLYSIDFSREPVTISPSYMKLTPVQVERDGLLVKSSELKETSIVDSTKQFTYLDFEIGNILAVGAVNMLKPVSMANHDIDGFANAISEMETQLNATPNENA